jgi:endonuclease/exonuclease/phosphatase family metal-dependent hydrolase
MSFNVFQRNTEIDALISIILEQDPDILALQEVTPDIGDQMVSKLSDRYPYHTIDLLDDEMGQALMSRYPIQQLSATPDYHYQTAIVDTPLGSIQIFNIHSPTLFPFSWKEHWQIQRSFFEGVLIEINQVEGPKIVLGDFNTTPLTELYALLTDDLSDTHLESGWGFGFSYPARPKLGIRLPTPLLRIDYIFTSDHFISVNTQVLKESGDSDHRPIKTELLLKQ